MLAVLSKTISDEQVSLNRQLHQDDSNYGNRSDGSGVAGNLPVALKRMFEMGIAKSMLDYGTGKGKLVHSLRKVLDPSWTVDGYDPAVDLWSKSPIHPMILFVVWMY